MSAPMRRARSGLLVPFAVLAAIVAAGSAARARPVVDRSQPLGESVQSRTIRAFERGDPSAPIRILVVGCVHGDEDSGVPVARRLLRGPAPSGVDLWIVPVLNPDGRAAGTRGNAHGVDLNRNFPFDWEPLPRGRYYAGPRALSEPESLIARDLILRLRPDITVWFHQPFGVVDLTGGDPAIERRYARLVGMHVDHVGDKPGSIARWQNHRFEDDTAFVVELPRQRLSPADVRTFADAVLRLAGPQRRARPDVVAGS